MNRLIWASCLLCIAPTLALPALDLKALVPLMKGEGKFVGVLSTPDSDRDSFVSTRIENAQFWTARDTLIKDSFFVNSAGWTSLTNGAPVVETGTLANGGDKIQVFGDMSQSYFPPSADQCGNTNAQKNGLCGGTNDNGGRWALWQDSPPLPVTTSDGVKLYTWIRNVWLSSGLAVGNGPFPSTSLYRTDYKKGAGTASLPPATLVKKDFFPSNGVSYGAYGWVIGTDGKAYLYGKGVYDQPYLARVAQTDIEDVGRYEYFKNGGWVKTPPGPIDLFPSTIANAGTGQQGTFYYSDHFKSYIWIGQCGGIMTPEFCITTAPRPEGPWLKPWSFLKVDPGSKFTYSFQAHPGMSDKQGNGADIYLSYTQETLDSKHFNRVFYVQWQT